MIGLLLDAIRRLVEVDKKERRAKAVVAVGISHSNLQEVMDFINLCLSFTLNELIRTCLIDVSELWRDGRHGTGFGGSGTGVECYCMVWFWYGTVDMRLFFLHFFVVLLPATFQERSHKTHRSVQVSRMVDPSQSHSGTPPPYHITVTTRGIPTERPCWYGEKNLRHVSW